MRYPIIETWLAVTALIAVTSAAEAQTRPDIRRLDSAAMLEHVRVLAHDSLQGRAAGTPGGAKARTYLLGRFREIGLQPVGGSHVHPFAFRRGRGGDSVEAANVVGMIPGKQTPGRYIVVTAHYDHLGPGSGDVYNGADDNASGTAALLALAQWFSRNPPGNSVIFAALDAEEGGLRGARAFVANPPVPVDSIVMNVNMDMVGRNDKDELYATGTLHYPFLKQYIVALQPASRVRLLMGHDEVPPGGRSSDNWTNASDHGAFHQRGIPFIYFGEEDHPDYHRPSDEFERLQPSFYVRAVETILDALLLFDANLGAIAAARR